MAEHDTCRRAQYGMIKRAYALYSIELRWGQDVGLARLPDVGKLTPNLTATLMNSDDKDERKTGMETHKGNER